MKVVLQAPKHRSDAARALADRRYHHRVVRSKKGYSRKGRDSSTRKFEDSIKPVMLMVGLSGSPGRKGEAVFIHKGKAVLLDGLERKIWLHRLDFGEVLLSDHAKNISKKSISARNALKLMQNLEAKIVTHYLEAIKLELAALEEVRKELQKIAQPPQRS